MDTQKDKPSADDSAPELRVSGKTFVIAFVAVSVVLAVIGTSMRLNVRPKFQAAVAASSAKAAEVDAARAAAAGSAKAEEPKK